MSRVQAIGASLAMLTVAALAIAFVPRHIAVPSATASHLEEIIPRRFGTWAFVPDIGFVTPATDDGDAERHGNSYFTIYSQIVSRAYADADGNVVMLMVAYGPVQDFRSKVHRPEFCYIASGFRVSDKFDASVPYRDGARPIAMTRLTAQREARIEPVSYWMRTGDAISHGAIDRQLIRLRFGLKGLVPDGVLIRISTIGLPPAESFMVQDRFIRDLLAAIPPDDVSFFVGKT